MLRLAKKLFLDTWAVFACFLLIYGLLFTRRVLMDIPAQMQTLQMVCRAEISMPPTALFYMLSWIGAFGQYESKLMLGLGAGLSCALLLTAKWWITRYILRAYLGPSSEMRHYHGYQAFGLAFVGSLPTADWLSKGWYIIGQASPNYWMNGTLLASWPFALILFWQSYRQLLLPEQGWWRWMSLWLVLLLVSKPSYALVFAVVYPVFLIGRHGLSKAVRWQLWPFALFGLVLGLEYYLVFLQAASVYVKTFNQGNPSGVAFCWLCVWRYYSTNIAVSILASVLFPLAASMMFWQDFRRKLLFWYSWAGFFAALVLSATLVQTGEEFYCWNFRWQTYIAAYLLFLSTGMLVWEKLKTQQFCLDFKAKLLGLIAMLHLLSGVLYLGKMWLSQSHY